MRGSVEHPLSNGEEFRDIQHSMSTVLDPTAILLQNATKVYYKMRQVFYYKMRQFYYKMRQLLQIATILLQKCNVYYKLRQYTDIGTLVDLH